MADYEIALDQLARSFAAVGELIDAIGPDQWSAATPCLDWTVHRLVEHLGGKNRVFTALLAEQPPPQRGDGVSSDQLAHLYSESAAELLAAFRQPGALGRSYQGPLGAATGAERLHIRMYDLLAHGWDLAQALGRSAELPEDAVEAALAFARADGRAAQPGGCFGPPRPVADDAPAIDRLVAFLGRDPSNGVMAAKDRIALDQLARSFAAVGDLIDAIRPEQWSAPTPCTDWTVHRLVEHLAGNRVFTALLAEQPPPQRGAEQPPDQLVSAYRESSAELLAAFAQPGVLDRIYQGPLGAATGRERLHIRMYDLLAHGWDLAQALGVPAVDLPDDAAEAALNFARIQLSDQSRAGRFAPAQPISEAAPPIVRLVAFLGRDVSTV